MYIRVQVCDCAAYNECLNLLNLNSLSLALICTISLRTRYDLSKVLKCLNESVFS